MNIRFAFIVLGLVHLPLGVSACDGDAADPERCNDGIDNNGDGLMDCEEPACFDVPPCGPENFSTVCRDELDNDGDGDTDCDDVDCQVFMFCRGG